MKDEIEKRVYDEAYNILLTDKTIREIAYDSFVSKSTVHKDLTTRLQILDLDIYEKVNKILKRHMQIRHIRGGESTKKKFEKIKKLYTK